MYGEKWMKAVEKVLSKGGLGGSTSFYHKVRYQQEFDTPAPLLKGGGVMSSSGD